MSVEPTETTRISDLAGLLALVPALVGYEPSDSVVVMFLKDQRLSVTMRADLDPRRLAYLVDRTLNAARQTGSTDLIVVGYSDKLTTAVRDVLVDLALAIENETMDADPPLRVHQLAAITADGWCEVDPWQPSEQPVMQPLDELSNHPVRVGRVLLGKVVAADRMEVAARVKPRSETPSTTFEVAAEAMIEALPGMPDEAVIRLVNQHLDQVEKLGVGEVLDDVTLAALTVLLAHPVARDESMLRIDPTTAQPYVEVWSRVVRLTDGRVANAALFLAGMCAWQLGDGAMTNCCAEAGAKIDPAHIGVQVLTALAEGCVPPEVFEAMKRDLRAAS